MKTELECRLQAIFQAYADGMDVAPALRYRTEGFAEALVAMGVLSESELETLIADTALQIVGTEAEMDPENRCRIPSLMKRAPVYPSTRAPTKP